MEISLSLSEFMPITAVNHRVARTLAPTADPVRDVQGQELTPIYWRPIYQSHMTFQDLNKLDIILYSI